MKIAVVGLRFGVEFVPIYQAHPDVTEVVVCDPSEEARARVKVATRYDDFQRVLDDETIDAVHILSPVRFHVAQTLAALGAGKHVACAVPMATTLEDLHKIVAAQKASGKNYMMMETAVYTREFLFVQELDMGRLTFLRGCHMQDLEGFPEYWRGYPIMLYATHAVAPCLALAKTRAAKTVCLGSATLRDDLVARDDNRFPVETAIFRLHGSDLAMEVSGSFFMNARPFMESFCAYGDKRSFEWSQDFHAPHRLFTMADEPTRWGRPVRTEPLDPPFRPDLLPPEIADMTIDGGHGGSHPHLVHEFVRSCVEGRPPRIGAVTAADWTAPGICAHASAQREGEPVIVPSFA